MTEPRKIHQFGWIPDQPDERDHLYAAPTQFLMAMPASVDLRKKCPPVYNQGALGSCTANAIAGAIEFDQMKQKLSVFVPSRLFIYYNERVIEHTVKSDSGAQIRDGIKTVASVGACPEPEWPYNIAKFANKPPQRAYNDAKLDRPTGASQWTVLNENPPVLMVMNGAPGETTRRSPPVWKPLVVPVSIMR